MTDNIEMNLQNLLVWASTNYIYVNDLMGNGDYEIPGTLEDLLSDAYTHKSLLEREEKNQDKL